MKTERRRLETTDLPELAVVLDRIVAAVRPERVFCLGVRVNNYEEWSVFKSAAPGTPHATVDLLVLIPSNDKRRIHEIDEALTLYNSATLQLNIMVHRASYVRKAVERGSYFFSQAVRLGEMLYQAEGAEKMLVPPWINVNATEALLRMEKRWYAWFDLARRSLTAARSCIERGEHVLGVCQLEHAAEFTCVALVRAATGYRPQTHNLHKLLELATGVSLSMAVVFPGITKEEEALLDTLQHAQAHTRFKGGFTVTAETARILAERVADLQDTALRIYSELMNEKVAAFEKPDEDLVAGEQNLYLNHERYER